MAQTLSDLRSTSRAKADESSTGFITNAVLDGYLNQGVTLIRNKIIQRFENYLIVEGTALNGGLFNTVATQQAYALPSDMQKLVRVEYRQANSTTDNDWRRVPTLNIGTDAGSTYFPIREGYLPEFGYFIAGDNIYFKPVPATIYSIRLWYIPRGTRMVLDADTTGIPSEYDDLVSEFGAIQCLRQSGEQLYKESSDIFKLELESFLETIEIRDQQPEQMVITEGQDLYRYGW